MKKIKAVLSKCILAVFEPAVFMSVILTMALYGYYLKNELHAQDLDSLSTGNANSFGTLSDAGDLFGLPTSVSISSKASKIGEPEIGLANSESLKDGSVTSGAASSESGLTANQTTSASQSQGPKRDISVLELEEYIANQNFSRNPSLESRGILVRTYERMALALCFPPIAFLVNNKTLDSDPRCNEILAKVKALHQNNTVVICAEKGVDSLECVRSFETQGVRKYRAGEIDKLNIVNNNKDPLSSPEVKARFTLIQKKLLEDITAFKNDRSIENLLKLDATFYPVLAIICSNDALLLSTQPTKAGTTLSNLGNTVSGSIAESIRFLEQDFSMPTPKPTVGENLAVENNDFFRSRILSDRCFDTIVDAVAIDSRLPSPLCFRDGFIGPSCLSALRRFQNLKDTKKPTESTSPSKGKSKDGLASF